MAQEKKTIQDRKGDTSRTSSQGRKLASGENPDKRRGNAEVNERNKTEKKELRDKKPPRR
jgi:hypothetical protein